MQKQGGDLYTFLFSVAVCLFASVLLSLAATVLKPFQKTNQQLEIVQNILMVSGHPSGASPGKGAPEETLKIFKDNFRPIILNKNNQEVGSNVIEDELKQLNFSSEELSKMYSFEILKIFEKKKKFLAKKKGLPLEKYDPGYKLLYVYQPKGEPEAFIIPVSGPGLWDMMYGYIALGADLNSIKGITFYNHKETPGLGGECEKPWFKNQFVNKKIFNEKGEFVSVTVAKGKAADGVKNEELTHYVDGISGATLTGKGISQFLKKDLGRFIDYFHSLKKTGAPTHNSSLNKTDSSGGTVSI